MSEILKKITSLINFYDPKNQPEVVESEAERWNVLAKETSPCLKPLYLKDPERTLMLREESAPIRRHF